MKFNEISLLTNKLEELRDFYENTLELQVIKENLHEFTMKAGSTAVTFQESEGDTEPFYHFTINTPQNKMEEAKAWIQSKVPLNKEQESMKYSLKAGTLMPYTSMILQEIF
jgi:catechol-2,3-dioxygenase